MRERAVYILGANVTNPKPDRRVKTAQVESIMIYPANSLWLKYDVTHQMHEGYQGPPIYEWRLKGHYGSLSEKSPQFQAIKEHLKEYEFGKPDASKKREFNALKLLLDRWESDSWYEMVLRWMFHTGKVTEADLREAWNALDNMSEEDWNKF